MNAWKPTDEQTRALCEAEALLFVGDPDYTAAQRFIAHPAFQSIIRAAQAEALREAAKVAYDEWPGGHGMEAMGVQWTEQWLDERANRLEASS